MNGTFKHVSRKWLYTAITRATELDNVYFMVSHQAQSTETTSEVDENEKMETEKSKVIF